MSRALRHAAVVTCYCDDQFGVLVHLERVIPRGAGESPAIARLCFYRMPVMAGQRRGHASDKFAARFLH